MYHFKRTNRLHFPLNWLYVSGVGHWIHITKDMDCWHPILNDRTLLLSITGFVHAKKATWNIDHKGRIHLKKEQFCHDLLSIMLLQTCMTLRTQKMIFWYVFIVLLLFLTMITDNSQHWLSIGLKLAIGFQWMDKKINK